MPPELYVYYRVPTREADRLRATVTALHDQLRRELPGLQARLLRRTVEATIAATHAAATDMDTWMETYALPPAARDTLLADALNAAVAQQAAVWRQLLGDGARHTEVFEPCA